MIIIMKIFVLLYFFFVIVSAIEKDPCNYDDYPLIPINEIVEPKFSYWKYSNHLKVGVIQSNPHFYFRLDELNIQLANEILEYNIEVLTDLIIQAANNKAKMVITNELSFIGYPVNVTHPLSFDNDWDNVSISYFADYIPGEITNYFGKLAKFLNIYLHIGMVERGENKNKLYNTVVVFNPQGWIELKVRKRFLYCSEKNYFTSGIDYTPMSYESPVGRIGISICWDFMFPLVSNYFTNKDTKIDVLAISTSWTGNNTGWDYFTKAATDFGAYVAVANQIYSPDSGVINPDGTSQSHIRELIGIAYGYLPLINKHDTYSLDKFVPNMSY